MIQVLPGGFCFHCNAEYNEDGYVHMKKHRACDTVPAENYASPEYRAWQVKHRSDTNKKLAEVFRKCGEIRSSIREIMFPDNPDVSDEA
jgi:hypothetical protein